MRCRAALADRPRRELGTARGYRLARIASPPSARRFGRSYGTRARWNKLARCGNICREQPYFSGDPVHWVRFFEAVVEPGAQRLVVLAIAYDLRFDGRDFVVSHIVSKYVLCGFDSLLSHHLSAQCGEGLPQAAVDTRISEAVTGCAWTPFPRRYCGSVAAAVTMAADLALGSSPRISVRLGNWGSGHADTAEVRVITRKTVSVLEQAMELCGKLAAPDFIDVRADLDRLEVRPRGSRLSPTCIDLRREELSIPPSEPGGTPDRQPLSDFADGFRSRPAFAAWLAQASQHVILLREDAIRRFRDAAEQRIVQVRTAINDRPLTGYRQELVSAFIMRLQAGLGNSLAGLNEAARVTVLDWAASIRVAKSASQRCAARPPRAGAEIRNASPRNHAERQPGSSDSAMAAASSATMR